MERRVHLGRCMDQHQVVVSTYAVLAEALSHGFVRISSLALLVSDEGEFPSRSLQGQCSSEWSTKQTLAAHHCTKKHPANTIMKNFYYPSKAVYGPSSVPHILGLSASLIMQSKLKSMQFVILSFALSMGHVS